MASIVHRSDGVDDAAIALRPTPGPRGSVRLVAAAIALWAAVTAALYFSRPFGWWIAPGELVWPVPPDVYAAAIFFATFAIILFVARVIAVGRARSTFDDGRGRGDRVEGLVAAAILLVLGLCAFARLTTQVVAFAGLHPAPVAASFDVVDVDTWSGKSSSVTHYLLRLRHGPAARTFDDEVRKPVYDAAQPGDTVTLPVETGRFGLQRAMIGAAPITVADLHHAAPSTR